MDKSCVVQTGLLLQCAIDVRDGRGPLRGQCQVLGRGLVMLVNGLLVYQDTAFTQKAVALQMALEVTEGMPLGFFFFLFYPVSTPHFWLLDPSLQTPPYFYFERRHGGTGLASSLGRGHVTRQAV